MLAHVLCCHIKISVDLNLSCVWILFQHASSHSRFRYFQKNCFHIESGNGPMIILVVSSLKEDIEADTLRQPRVFHGRLTFCSRDESCQARALGFPCRTNIAIVTRLSKHTLWDFPEEGALQS